MTTTCSLYKSRPKRDLGSTKGKESNLVISTSCLPKGGLIFKCKSLPFELYLHSGSSTTKAQSWSTLPTASRVILPSNSTLLRLLWDVNIQGEHTDATSCSLNAKAKWLIKNKQFKSKYKRNPWHNALLAKPVQKAPGNIQLNCKINWAFRYLSNNNRLWVAGRDLLMDNRAGTISPILQAG